MNDTLDLKNVAAFPASEPFIYNCWGELVFYNQGGGKAWDGNFRNAYVPAGSYPYAIRYPYDDSSVHRGTRLSIR
ncbi:gliding motility-associated C-terminal domain-containing protein [Rhabdobacter roseus]|uniref:T9SS type B sorting domain-containing protein n=1 Tax=Rhabdobacter roseus TaxID=1655419 RepID=UPI003CCD057E